MSTPPPEPKPSLLSNAWTLTRAVMDLVMDFSFQKFVTPKLVRVIYALSLVAALLSGLTWMFSGFANGITHGLFTLVTGPVAFFVYVLCARVAMELILAVFAIAEGIKKLEEKNR